MEKKIDAQYLDYEQSFREFKSLLTTDFDLDSYPPVLAENTTFGSEFPGALIRKPQYSKCTFVGSTFNASDGAFSKFHHCRFYDCKFDNCDFRYSDLFDDVIGSKHTISTIESCNFSFSNFVNSTFSKIKFGGCSFRQMQFENTHFNQCSMQYSSIEQSSFKNCSISNLDLSKVSVRYCSFEDVTFDNVTFHILDLARNYGLMPLLQHSTGIVVAFGNSQTVSLQEAIDRLGKLIPYYIETQQYYELLNLYASTNNFAAILNILPRAFESVISRCDFAALQDLCELIVKYRICTEVQLREFYALIKQLIVPNNYPHYLRKSYNLYIENIKHLLVDNPYGYPEAKILLKTNIETLEDPDMSKLLTSIETNIRELAPSVDAEIQLTHHSPYDVLVVLYGALPEILTVCQMFYYVLGGAKAYSEIKNSLNEKTHKKKLSHSPNNAEENEESVKRVELSVGKFFSFKYEKEYSKRVESVEYTIN